MSPGPQWVGAVAKPARDRGRRTYRPSSAMNKHRDETYILDLCDELLGMKSVRQHTFEFLRGDGGRKLPVDGYYPSINLVVEYRERQHFESVALFDKRKTVSGVSRAEQ